MTKANTKTNSGKLTKRDLFRANWRWLWGSQLSWNYERMMAPGYFYAVLPFLKRWYKDDELVEMMQMQTQFFNVNAYVGNFITGVDLALEESQGIKSKDTVAGIKTGLMGPLAGIGDTNLQCNYSNYLWFNWCLHGTQRQSTWFYPLDPC